MKHYRMRLELSWDDSNYPKGELRAADFTPVVSTWLRHNNIDPNIVDDFEVALDEPFSYGFTDMTSKQVIDLLTAIAGAFPEVRFYARGIGLSFGDIWLREFYQGAVVFEEGPFHNTLSGGKKGGWLSKLFR